MIKKVEIYYIGLLLSFLSLLIVSPHVSHANEFTVDGDIEFAQREDPQYGVLDPEDPQQQLIENSDSRTEGPLRIDFVPQLSFSENKSSSKDEVYQADALLFPKVVKPRGSFVQVSDYREKPSGWTLQLKQDIQFKNEKNATLDGAVISFDKSWVNTANGVGSKPVVAKEIIRLNNIGETYDLAKANKGTMGTWSIVFGASQDNKDDQDPTLSPRLDKEGKPIKDPNLENQPVYANSAVNLSVPGGTKKEAGIYSTVLTWIISELP
ncbi:WxL domain-containing protein [Enterococcus rotai]|uniref:WxL domain-containing protein n=1 Tax=Enterococcus rotai TaxID=118060 RepID=UPI0032B48AEB